MNEVLLRKKEKHRKTIDMSRCSVKRLGEVENLIIGEVMGKYDLANERFCFFVKDNKITVSDLKGTKSTIDCSYNLTSGIWEGKGIRTKYEECERLISYVLIMLEHLDKPLIR